MMTWQPTAAIIIFLILYAIWLTDQLNRAVIAIVGAVLFLLLGIVQWNQALTLHMNWNTLLLWTGMMMIAGVMSRSGWIERGLKPLIVLSGSRPAVLFFMFSLYTALGAAFLDAVTMIILMIPLVLRMTEGYRLKAAPFLISLILSANLGAAATLIGNPVNMWVGTANAHVSFMDFLVILGPVLLIVFVVQSLLVYLFYFKTLSWKRMLIFQPEESESGESLEIGIDHTKIHKRIIPIGILVVFILVIAALSMSSIWSWQPGMIAAAGALILLGLGIAAGWQPIQILRGLEWDTLLFFAGLFVLAGGLIETGWVTAGATWLIELTNGNMMLISLIMLWMTGLLSMAMDSMPWVAVIIPLIQQTGEQMDAGAASILNPIWWSLALGAGLGGSGTLLGSAAGLLTASIAAQKGKRLGYWEFFRVALPLTLLALGIASLYIVYVLIGK